MGSNIKAPCVCTDNGVMVNGDYPGLRGIITRDMLTSGVRWCHMTKLRDVDEMWPRAGVDVCTRPARISYKCQTCVIFNIVATILWWNNM